MMIRISRHLALLAFLLFLAACSPREQAPPAAEDRDAVAAAAEESAAMKSAPRADIQRVCSGLLQYSSIIESQRTQISPVEPLV